MLVTVKMNTRFTLVLLIVLVALLVGGYILYSAGGVVDKNFLIQKKGASVKQDLTSSGKKVYKNSVYKYSFEYPLEWNLEEVKLTLTTIPKILSYVALRSPSTLIAPGESIPITVFLVEAAFEQEKKTARRFIGTDEKARVVNGVSAVEYGPSPLKVVNPKTGQIAEKDTYAYGYRAVVVPSGGNRTYTITLESPQYEVEFEDVVSSFRLEN